VAIRRRQHPRGIALLLVVMLLALASTMGYVMLSGVTLQNRSAANQVRLSTADYLAESGLNLAMYYLQHPDLAPILNSSGYWGGTSGDLAISSSIPGTVNVTVTRDATDSWSYEIVCVAKAGTSADTQVTRTTGARVYVRNEFSITKAAAFNTDVTVPAYWTVNGDVWTKGKLGIKKTLGAPVPSVTGAAYCKSWNTGLNYLTPQGGYKAVPNADWPGPSGTNDLNLYNTYTIADTSYSCVTLSGTSLSSVTKNPTVSNPGGVLYKDASSDGPYVLLDNVQIYGTLVVNGDLEISGANIAIYPKTNFPALIVTGTLQIDQPKCSLTANGVCFVGKTVKSSGSTPGLPTDISTFTVNGALVVGATSGSPLASSYNVLTTVTYDPTKAVAPQLSSVQHAACGVSVVRWGLP